MQVQFDNIRHLDFRALAVQYVKWVSVPDKKHEFDFGVGPMLEFERWVNFEEGDHLVTRNLAKLSSYIGWYTSIGEKVSISLYNIYQVGYDPISELWRHRASTSFQISDHLTRHIDLVVKFTGAYDARPIVPVSIFIYELSNGIRFRF